MEESGSEEPPLPPAPPQKNSLFNYFSKLKAVKPKDSNPPVKGSKEVVVVEEKEKQIRAKVKDDASEATKSEKKRKKIEEEDHSSSSEEMQPRKKKKALTKQEKASIEMADSEEDEEKMDPTLRSQEDAGSVGLPEGWVRNVTYRSSGGQIYQIKTGEGVTIRFAF